MTQRTASITLKYAVDQSSIQTATLANTKVLDSIKGVGFEAQSVAEQLAGMGVDADEVFTKSGDKITTGLTEPLDAANAKATALEGTIHDIGLQITALPDPDLGAFEGESADSGGGLSLAGSRGALRAGAQLLGADAGGGALRGAGQVVALVSALGPVGLLAAAGAAGLRAFTSAQEAEEKATEARLDTERKAAHDISDVTSQQLQDKIKTAQASLDIDKEVARQQTANAALYTISISDQPLKLGAALAGLDPTYNAYQDALAKNGVAIEGDQALVDIYTGALNKNATAVADNAAASKQLADQLVASANQTLEIDKLTTEQRNTRAEQDRRDISLLNDQIQAGGLTEQAAYDLSVQQGKLYADYQAVTSVSTTYAQQLLDEAAAKQSLNDTEQQLLDNLKDQDDARKKIADTEAEITQIRQDAADKAVQAETDKNTKISQAETDADDKFVQIYQDQADKLSQIEQDGKDKRAKILSDFNESYAEALYGRDALAAYKAEQKRDKDLADQAADEKKAKDQLDKATQKQLDAVDAALDKQKRSIEQAYNDQLRTIQDGEAKQLAAKNLALSQEQKALNDLTVAAGLFSQAVALAQARVSALAGTTPPPASTGTGGSSNIPPIAPNIGDTWTDSTGKLWLWNGHGWQPATAVRQLATGGVASGLARVNDGSGVESGYNYRTNQLMMFTDPVQVFSAPQTNRMFSGGSGGISISLGGIHGSNLSRDDIKELVWDEIDDGLDKAGWPTG